MDCRERRPCSTTMCAMVKNRKEESIVMADGAKCYFQVRDSLACRLHQAPYSKNIYNRRTSTKRTVNTGSLDLLWRRLKDRRANCPDTHPGPITHEKLRTKKKKGGGEGVGGERAGLQKGKPGGGGGGGACWPMLSPLPSPTPRAGGPAVGVPCP